MLKFVASFAVCWLASLVVTPQAAAFVIYTGSYRPYLTEDAKQEILDMHNELRRLEPAANMEKMVWNDYFADMGDVWARMCLWDHGQPSNMTSAAPYSPIGQNLYITTARSSQSIDEVGIQLWYNEIVDYDYDTATCNEGKVCGHYTQVVWATSREIGCGVYVCPSIVVGSSIWDNVYYLVCNYGPAGNWRGEKPYENGTSCSNCHPDRPYCDNKLCTAEQPRPVATTPTTLTEAMTAATRAPTESTTPEIVASTVTSLTERTTQVSAETTTKRTAMTTTMNETLLTTVKTESATKIPVVVTEEQTTVKPGIETTATHTQGVTTEKITTQTEDSDKTTVTPSGEQTEEPPEVTETAAVVTTRRPGGRPVRPGRQEGRRPERPGRPGRPNSPGRRPLKSKTSIIANSMPNERRRSRRPNRP